VRRRWSAVRWGGLEESGAAGSERAEARNPSSAVTRRSKEWNAGCALHRARVSSSSEPAARRRGARRELQLRAGGKMRERAGVEGAMLLGSGIEADSRGRKQRWRGKGK
jgi:hypothetical protein